MSNQRALAFVALTLCVTGCTQTVHLGRGVEWSAAFVNASGRTVVVRLEKNHLCRMPGIAPDRKRECEARNAGPIGLTNVASAVDLKSLLAKPEELDQSLPESARRSQTHDLSFDGARGLFVLPAGTSLFAKTTEPGALLRLRIRYTQ